MRSKLQSGGGDWISVASDDGDDRMPSSPSRERVDSPTVSCFLPDGSPAQSGDPRVFPLLILLQAATLRGLKSNTVGPRKPHGGVLSALLGARAILSTIIDLFFGVMGSTTAAFLRNLSLLIDLAQIITICTS